MIEVTDLDGGTHAINPAFVVEVVAVYARRWNAAIRLHTGEWIRTCEPKEWGCRVAEREP